MKTFYTTLRAERLNKIQSYNLDRIRIISKNLNGICEQVESGKIQPCRAKKMFKEYLSKYDLFMHRFNVILYNNQEYFNVYKMKEERNYFSDIVINSKKYLFF